MKNQTIGVFVVAAFAVLAIGGVAAFGFGNGFMAGNSDSTEMQAFHEKVQTAVENNDFVAWKSLMESQLTQDNFNQMVEMHDQMQEMQDLRQQLRDAIANGDTDTANQIRTQLSEKMPEGMGIGYARGFKQGFGHGMGMMHEDCPFAQTE